MSDHRVDLRNAEFPLLDRRSPGYRAWQPIAIAAIGGFVVIVLVAVAAVLLGSTDVLAPGSPTRRALDRMLDEDAPPATWWLAVFSLGSVILLLPALAAARAIVRRRGLGLLASIRGRIRWRWMLMATLPALAFAVIEFGGSVITDLIIPGQVIPAARADWSVALPTIITVVVLTPLQCATEEFVFRGFVFQTVAGWSRSPITGAVVSTFVFVAGHGYDAWGSAEVAVTGFALSLVAMRTGGIEAGIVLHTANNLPLFIVGALDFPGFTASGSGTWQALAVTLVSHGVWVAVVLAAWNKWVESHSRDGESIVDAPAPCSIRRSSAEPPPQGAPASGSPDHDP